MTLPLTDASVSVSKRRQLLPESATTTTPFFRQHSPDGLLNLLRRCGNSWFPSG